MPLHRRGTSKTYERLEDLLREAGYKETRVFTPETERAEAEAEERKERELRRGQSGSVRGGVGAVVGFLTGLMSRTPSLARDAGAEAGVGSSSGSQTTPSLQQEYSPPPSPLAHKPQLKSKRKTISSHSHSPSPTTPVFTSSAESLARSLRSSFSNVNTASRIENPNATSDLTPRATLRGSSSYSETHGNARPSRPRPQPAFSNQVPQTYAEASKARAYLRHMASAPSIHPSSRNSRPTLVRHSSTKCTNRAGSGFGYAKRKTLVLDDSDADVEDEYMGRKGNGEGEDETETYGRPPLPRTWLENVARAVLFGGTGAHGGVPSLYSPSHLSHSHSQSPKSRLEALRMSPAPSTNSALSDHTSTPQTLALKGRSPPLLCVQVAAHRTPSETRLSRTRVVCRSAPASRSGSRVRGGRIMDADLGMNNRVDRGNVKCGGEIKRKDKPEVKKGAKEKSKLRGRSGVPSLASTHAQNDGWSNLMGRDEEVEISTSLSSSEDDEGELDLERLLVPPKRQNSIRSLRRHLHGQLSPPPNQGITSSSTSSAPSGSRNPAGGIRDREGLRRGGQEQEHQDNDEDEDEDWRRGILGMDDGSLSARHGRGMRDEGEMSGGSNFGGGRTGNGTGTKRRGGFPGAWA